MNAAVHGEPSLFDRRVSGSTREASTARSPMLQRRGHDQTSNHPAWNGGRTPRCPQHVGVTSRWIRSGRVHGPVMAGDAFPRLKAWGYALPPHPRRPASDGGCRQTPLEYSPKVWRTGQNTNRTITVHQFGEYSHPGNRSQTFRSLSHSSLDSSKGSVGAVRSAIPILKCRRHTET